MNGAPLDKRKISKKMRMLAIDVGKESAKYFYNSMAMHAFPMRLTSKGIPLAGRRLPISFSVLSVFLRNQSRISARESRGSRR